MTNTFRWRDVVFGAVLGVFAVLLASWLTADLSAQTCLECTPGDNGNRRRTDQTIPVCFSGAFSPEQRTAIWNGIGYWNSYFASLIGSGYPAGPYFVESTGSCEVTFSAAPSNNFPNPDDDYAAAFGSSDPTANTSIMYNTGRLPLNADTMAMVAAHELGHILGFADRHNSGCAQSTVMTDPLPGGAPGNSRCADEIIGTRVYGSGYTNPSGGGTESKPETVGGASCNAWYLVTREYVWIAWANEWFMVSETWDFLYVDEGSCVPLDD